MKLTMPKVSVFWVNYNSMHVIEVIKKSLSELIQIEYPKYEIIIVDNGSTDKSLEFITKYISELRRDKGTPEVKIIRLKRNMGFTGGVNAAYRVRDRMSKYVAIVNNDAIPYKDYLLKLVRFMERHSDVGAVQGIVLKMNDAHKIDSAGMFIDEAINVYAPYINKPVSTIYKSIYVSYVEGTMPLYRVSAIKCSLRNDISMYITTGFVYFLEDVFLSLMMWNQNYKCAVLPVISGEHYRMATLKKFYMQIGLPYYYFRNRTALLCMTNSKENRRVILILKLLRSLILSRGGYQMRKDILRAVIDGIRLTKTLKEKYGDINIYKSPLIKTSIKRRLKFSL